MAWIQLKKIPCNIRIQILSPKKRKRKQKTKFPFLICKEMKFRWKKLYPHNSHQMEIKLNASPQLLPKPVILFARNNTFLFPQDSLHKISTSLHNFNSFHRTNHSHINSPLDTQCAIIINQLHQKTQPSESQSIKQIHHDLTKIRCFSTYAHKTSTKLLQLWIKSQKNLKKAQQIKLCFKTEKQSLIRTKWVFL